MGTDRDELITALYHAEYQKLVIYAQAALGHTAQAEDLVQDTFLQAALYEGLVEHPSPMGWLYRTLKNKLREYRRATFQEMQDCVSLDTGISPVDPHLLYTPGHLLDKQELSAWERIRQALTPDEFYVLRRVALEKANHPQVARELGISVATSHQRLSRSYKKLKKAFPGCIERLGSPFHKNF